MDESKKPLMIGVIVVCFVLAGGIFWYTNRGGGGGINEIPSDEMQWMLCRNAACNAAYQIPKRDFARHMQENFRPMTNENPAMVCRECGKKSVFQAVKCANCEKVFPYGTVPNDFADRCPECEFSATEDKRERRRAAAN